MKNGFTLIELLVVIAIIGILTSVVFASIQDAKPKTPEDEKEFCLKQLRINTMETLPAACVKYLNETNVHESGF